MLGDADFEIVELHNCPQRHTLSKRNENGPPNDLQQGPYDRLGVQTPIRGNVQS